VESALPGLTTLGLAFLAGLVTMLSPCVLPLLPVVAVSAGSRSRWGVIALAVGMALAYTVIGVTLASSGQLLGMDDRGLRFGAGVLMIGFAAVLLSTRLQAGLARATGVAGAAGGNALTHVRSDHPAAQFAVGGLLGVAWSPCVGPTLGAAIALAASGGGSSGAAIVMSVFGVAAVLPLILAGLLGRGLLHRARLLRAGDVGRRLMGWSLLLVGALVVSGLDKRLEAWLLDASPAWLVEFTTRF
jgi:cytochrome c biogenesis protein CcdA